MSQTKRESRKKVLRTRLKRKHIELGRAPVVIPNERLASLIGTKERSRSEVIEEVWNYIKRNNLYNEQSGQVEADEKLLPLFFGRRVVRRKDVGRYVILNIHPGKSSKRKITLRLPTSVVEGGFETLRVHIPMRRHRHYGLPGRPTKEPYDKVRYNRLPGKISTGLPRPDKDELEEEV